MYLDRSSYRAPSQKVFYQRRYTCISKQVTKYFIPHIYIQKTTYEIKGVYIYIYYPQSRQIYACLEATRMENFGGESGRVEI